MHRLFPPVITGPGAVGLLLVRLVMGTAFMLHGWPKIQHPLSWMGEKSPVPGFFQMLAAVSEFGGGIALILGLLTPLAALGIAATMLAALGIVHLPQGDPFVGKPGQASYELALGYLANALLFILVGPGSLSLDALFWNRSPPHPRPL